ncbi:ileal sodium/bile acid cotransporter-like [Saccoglossus kowalevskii]|uniref:Ileal sodium/bile acid cotransporter-like n=1 Tax=Saccoglossus kowalevskii TaxID=10224 RepID=A0ABM0GN97_SACKO|nr:PREDICTED: ileal sodium/bile acid cotransporter-like [Saccoglossus kowalevskii]
MAEGFNFTGLVKPSDLDADMDDFESFTELWVSALSGAVMGNASNSTGNATVEEWHMSPRIKALKLAQRTTVIIVALFVMIAMGCSITYDEIMSHLRRPVGVFIGFVCQYGMMPLIAFGLAHAFKLDFQYAIGVLVMACCPGGNMSNMLTYWLDGDLSLSICMTTCSTVVAFGMMPLSLFIYSKGWSDQELVIPYLQIFLALVGILAPVTVGFFIRYKSEHVAAVLSKVFNIISLIGVALINTFECIMRPNTFTDHPSLWLIGCILPATACTLSYILAMLAKMSKSQCRTVAVETGVQNVGLALTLMLLSYPNDRGRTTAFPAIYMVIEASFLFLMVPVGIMMSKRSKKEKDEKKDDEEMAQFTRDEAGVRVNVINGDTTAKTTVSNGKQYIDLSDTTSAISADVNGYKMKNGDTPLHETCV